MPWLSHSVNDTYIGEIRSVLDMKEWFLGLTVCGKRTITFDRLKAIERWKSRTGHIRIMLFRIDTFS
ncbi:MAG TPA: hypothetical protein VF905_08875 [Nitrospirota bacterium]